MFQEYPVSQDVTLRIYEIYLKYATDKVRLGTDICFDDGSCYDPDDPSVYPVGGN